MELWGGSYWLMMVHGSWIYIYIPYGDYKHCNYGQNWDFCMVIINHYN